ncbi:MAG: DUF4251 domain-containing protein [Rikenellaceae bacterium]
MKRATIVGVIIAAALTYSVVANRESDNPNPKSERREVRENRRAERQAAMEREIDSLMVARAFVFRPSTIQREPAGRMTMLSNPNFEIRVWDGAADIFLPYISGVVPPYRHEIINYTLPLLSAYTALQTENGWTLSFQSNLFSASTYTFKFDINAKFGTTTLTLANTWNNNVTYTGIISRIY